MQGTPYRPPMARAILASPLRANGKRQDYIRARLTRGAQGPTAEPFALQDSSMQKVFAHADCLIVRAVNAPAVEAGAIVDIFMLNR